MKNSDYEGSGREVPAWMQVGRSDFLLRSEVAFWRDLLESCGDTVPPESRERMQQAMALAERRLLQVYAAYRDELKSSGSPAATSEPGGTWIN